jgi:excisionase family DNA binding protein
METLINPIEILLKITERLEKIESQLGKLNETFTNKRVNRVMTVKETCKYLNISSRTLQRYRDEGYIDFIQVGMKVQFRSEDLEKFLEKHHIKTRNVGK